MRFDSDAISRGLRHAKWNPFRGDQAMRGTRNVAPKLRFGLASVMLILSALWASGVRGVGLNVRTVGLN